MSLCKNGMQAIRIFSRHVDDELLTIIDDVTAITGKIKAFESNPVVQQVEQAIPEGSAYISAFNTALDAVAGVATEALTVAERIASWLAGKTTIAVHGDLNKLAAQAVAAADTNKQPLKTELFYDTVVQNSFATSKAAQIVETENNS